MNRRTVMFQPCSGTGLGHVSRLIAIALALRGDDDPRPLFVVEGTGRMLLEAYGLAHLLMPSDSEFGLDGWKAWSATEKAAINVSLADAILRTANPELIVFDCFPSRAMALAAIERDVPIAMCVREMREPEVYFELARPVLERAKVIVVPGESAARCVPPSLAHKTVCVGAITRPSPAPGVTRIRGEGDPHITITGGGGAYPECVPFFNRAMAAVARCRTRHAALRATLVTGPLFTAWAQLQPMTGTRIVPFVPNMLELLTESALAFCQGGYNTIAEATCAGVPIVCQPAATPHDDQRQRVTALASRHERIRVLSDDVDEEQLADWIEQMLRPAQPPAPLRLPPGAARAADALRSVLERPLAILQGQVP
jgi:predicted glycosyltransferase